MSSPRSSDPEKARLEELASFHILDTAPEDYYDLIVKLVSESCQTPIAFLGLTDSKRHWLKAKVGIESHSLDRETSFCLHVVRSGQPLVIPDAKESELFSNTPLVLNEPHIRFYAGVPLITARDHIIGTLCVLDSKPRSVNPQQMTSLLLLSRLVMEGLEARRVHFMESEIVHARTKELYNETERLRGALVSAARMSVLGEIAAGIAHEINNPLAVISMRSQLISSIAEGGAHNPAALVEAASKIEETLGRIKKVIKGIKSFSQNYEMESFSSSDISEVLNEALELCQMRIRSSGIEFRYVPPPKGIRIECRPVQLSQVLLNLISNAADAVQGCEEKWIELIVEDLEGSVRIKVIDSGKGIPPEVRDKLMTPFFTTKPIGKGTGLGLSLSKKIIESHNGKIYLDSESPRTCFVVELPKQQTTKRSA